MKSINPYLNFKGNAEAAFNFYKSVFGGSFTGLQRFKDTPEAGNISTDEREKIMHIAMPLGRENILMASDVTKEYQAKFVVGNNIYLTIETDSQEEADRLFDGLSDGGKVEMAMQKTFWNAYFGMCTDKFGIQWMITFDLQTLK